MGYSSLLCRSLKSGEKSHKNLPKGTFFFLRLYYEKRNVMGLLCVGHELFLLAVYMLHFIPGLRALWKD